MASSGSKRVFYDPHYHPSLTCTSPQLCPPPYPAQNHHVAFAPYNRASPPRYDDFSVYNDLHVMKPQSMPVASSSYTTTPGPAPYVPPSQTHAIIPNFVCHQVDQTFNCISTPIPASNAIETHGISSVKETFSMVLPSSIGGQAPDSSFLT
ncbi:hypothetical protein GOP47_0005683 [Adiantum capillus-veneris]|uniref:Uncharacterized protein n=1 Tax=Adiantum capillus-veneris TaxID=13818 RepID=A0A9D4V5L1_ADICA|nr:hypothetical protein GOP47_0005683 [Adiantum capillus-veneris]